MDWQQAQKELLSRLSTLYEDREAAVITDWVMEQLTGWKKIDRLLHRSEPLPPAAIGQLKKYTEELLRHRPVQYVLQESWFCGMKFYVDERVLIPRPETEELVEWIAAEARPSSLLDVGTGSGCIAISLKKKLNALTVHACDLSEGALAVARQNATTLDADIRFQQIDFLREEQWQHLPTVDLLVSNPPYIPITEKAGMAPHVVGFEPHLALFVEDNDPLVFYQKLAGFANRKLAPGGSIFVEIHEELSGPVMELFRKNGFPQTIVKKDMQGKDRMIKATR
ncbi:MAG TPA: peptide chain release factor N(5)-glutamine methyltransferase [Puia sp.]|jgi:release factor glutamine methyltransferase